VPSRLLAIAVGVFLAACHASAEKRIVVKITHFPVLGASLAGKRIVIGPLAGECSQELAEILKPDLASHGLEAAGAETLALSIQVERCQALPLPPILGSGLPAMHIARTEGHFQATLQVTDPAGRHELASITVRGDAQKENQSQTSTPEHPAPAEVKSIALHQAFAQAQRLYLPWTENREIPFMDGKECNVRDAIEPARSGDYAGLVKVAKAAADSCAPGSKASAQAWYNLGVASMLVRRYDDALAAFDQAKDLNSGKLVAGLADECRQESVMAKARQPKPPAAEAAGEVRRTGMVLTNDLIIRLVDGNVAEDEIIKMIGNQPTRFSLEPGDIAKLKAAGVPDSVVAAMRNQK